MAMGERFATGLRARLWPLGFAAVAVFVFFLYHSILPNLTDSIQSGFQHWLPLSSVNEALVWVIMALGLNVVVGYAGLLDLCYVAFWAIGGYTGAWLMSTFAFDKDIKFHLLAPTNSAHLVGIHISFWLVLIAAAAFCAVWGVIIGAPTLRLRSDYLAIVTLGFGQIIPEFFTNAGDVPPGHLNISNGTKGITPLDPIGMGPLSNIPGVNPTLGPFDLPYRFAIFAVLAGLCMFVSLRIRDGRLGRAWLAIREDELAASMMGVPLMRTKLAAYAVGAAFGGVGGVVYASHNNATLPSFSFNNSITILLMVVVGGMGNVWGVTIGALLLAWINSTGLGQFGDWFDSTFSAHINFPSYNYMIFGILLVLMMLFRREGFLPEQRTRQILREPTRTEMESIGADIEGAEAEIELEQERAALSGAAAAPPAESTGPDGEPR
jgi:branched-chain amino acid transport system permease protein